MLNPTLSLLLAQTRQRELLDEAERNRTPLSQSGRARPRARRAWHPGPPEGASLRRALGKTRMQADSSPG